MDPLPSVDTAGKVGEAGPVLCPLFIMVEVWVNVWAASGLARSPLREGRDGLWLIPPFDTLRGGNDQEVCMIVPTPALSMPTWKVSCWVVKDTPVLLHGKD